MCYDSTDIFCTGDIRLSSGIRASKSQGYHNGRSLVIDGSPMSGKPDVDVALLTILLERSFLPQRETKHSMCITLGHVTIDEYCIEVNSFCLLAESIVCSCGKANKCMSRFPLGAMRTNSIQLSLCFAYYVAYWHV